LGSEHISLEIWGQSTFSGNVFKAKKGVVPGGATLESLRALMPERSILKKCSDPKLQQKSALTPNSTFRKQSWIG
jgi:hypothetical protein